MYLSTYNIILRTPLTCIWSKQGGRGCSGGLLAIIMVPHHHHPPFIDVVVIIPPATHPMSKVLMRLGVGGVSFLHHHCPPFVVVVVVVIPPTIHPTSNCCHCPSFIVIVVPSSLSLSLSFHLLSTPQAVACEARGGWCVVPLLSLSHPCCHPPCKQRLATVVGQCCWQCCLVVIAIRS